MLKYSIPVCITWIILVFITFTDVIFVKHYFDDYHTGIYSSASVIAKIGFFLSSVLMSVFFPELINNDKIEKSSIPLLTFMLGITLLICGSYVLVVFFFKEFLITLLFGEKYLLAAQYLTKITIFMSIVGVITVIFNFFLAKEIYSYLSLHFCRLKHPLNCVSIPKLTQITLYSLFLYLHVLRIQLSKMD